MNRSLSVIRSTPIKNTNATQIHKNKSTIAPKDVEKRFSSSNVRVIAANERVETLEARNAKNGINYLRYVFMEIILSLKFSVFNINMWNVLMCQKVQNSVVRRKKRWR